MIGFVPGLYLLVVVLHVVLPGSRLTGVLMHFIKPQPTNDVVRLT